MKKIMIMALLFAFCAPAFAADKCEGDCPMKKMGKRDRAAWAAKNPEMKAKMDAKKEAFRKERKARKEAFKKNEEKVEKLVKEYKKLKPGKKQDAKRAEIAAVIAGFRDEQISFKENQLKQFQDRLAKMQDGLAKESAPTAKDAWVNAKVDRVIADDGDLDAVFEHDRMMPRPPMGPMGPEGMSGPGPVMMPGDGPAAEMM